MQAGIFGAYILGNYSINQLLKTRQVDELINLGLLITLAGGVLMIFFVLLLPLNLFCFLITMTVYSFGSGLCFAPLNRSIIEASDAPMGVKVALFTVFFTAFGALGSAFASVFFNGSINSLAWLIGTCIIISSGLKYVRLKGA